MLGFRFDFVHGLDVPTILTAHRDKNAAKMDVEVR